MFSGWIYVYLKSRGGYRLYKFPRAAATNYHHLGGFKQQIFIPSWFWRPEARNEGARKLSSFWGLWRRIYSTPLLQYLLVVGSLWHCLGLWLRTPVFASTFTCLLLFTLCPLFFCFTQGHLSLDIGTILIQDDLTSRSLISSANTFFLNKVTFADSRWTYILGDHHSTHFTILEARGLS